MSVAKFEILDDAEVRDGVKGRYDELMHALRNLPKGKMIRHDSKVVNVPALRCNLITRMKSQGIEGIKVFQDGPTLYFRHREF